MNSVLDILKLRRIRFAYVSPPVCPTVFSSGSSFSGSCFLELGLGFSECDAPWPAPGPGPEPGPGPSPLRISGPAAGFCSGVPYVSQFTAIGASVPCVWVLLSGGFPPGVVFSSGPQPGNTASVTGTPSAGGSYSYAVRCVDSSGAQGDLTGTISGIQILEAPALPAATTDTAYSEQLHATGGTSPFSFSLSSGSLSSGLSLSSGGLLSGIPRYDGTYSFTVTATDSGGTSCSVPIVLAVNPCPVISTYPTIAQWGSVGDGHHGPQANFIRGAFDQSRRIWWIPRTEWLGGSGLPYQVVSLIDTQSISLAGYATDTLGLITGQAQGDTGNGMGRTAIDTKYNQCVVGGNQGWYAWYDLDSKNCLAVTHVLNTHNTQQFLSNTVAYDSTRGYIYMMLTTSSPISVTILDCNPSVRNAIGDYAVGAQAGGPGDYCPTTDLVYIVNPSGAHIYSTWDPNTTIFSLNVAAAPLGSGINIKYLPGINLLAVDVGGDVLFVDPATHAQVGHAPGLATFSNMVYNSCNNMIYASSQVFSGIIRCDPASGFSTTNIAAVFPGTLYQALAFDKDGSRVFLERRDNWTIETGV